MKDQNGGRSVYFYSFFNLGSRWGGWLTTPLTALPHGITRCPLYRRLGGDQARSGKAIGPYCKFVHVSVVRLRLKCDGTRVETRFRLSAKRTSPFKWTGASVQSTTGSRGVRISGSNAGYTMLRSSVKSTGYPLHSPVSPSLPPPVRHRVQSHFNWTLQQLEPRLRIQISRLRFCFSLVCPVQFMDSTLHSTTTTSKAIPLRQSSYNSLHSLGVLRQPLNKSHMNDYETFCFTGLE